MTTSSYRWGFFLGRELNMKLTVTNTGDTPLPFEEAFHTYFRVMDVHEATITGLETVKYIDKTDAMTVKPADDVPIAFTRMSIVFTVIRRGPTFSMTWRDGGAFFWRSQARSRRLCGTRGRPCRT